VTVERSPSSLTALEGREPLVRALVERISLVERSGALLVCGPAGIGKSALIDTALARVDAVVGRGKIAQLVGPNSLAPIREALQRAVDDAVAGEPDRDAVLARLGHDVGPLLGLVQGAVEVGSDPGTLDRFLECALAVTTALVKFGRPVVLFIDDVHWAESPALALLAKLLKFGPAQGLFVVAGSRNAAIGLDGERLEVEPLDIADAARLVGSIVGGDHALARNIVEILGMEASSTPFRLLEAVRLLVHNGTLVRAGDGAWWLTALSLDAELRLENRLANLAPEMRRVASIAACLGDRFRRSDLDAIVERASGAPPAPGVVDGLVAMAIFTQADGNLRFAHDLLQESAARDLAGDELQRVHQLAAEAHRQRYQQEKVAGEALQFATHATLASVPTPELKAAWIEALADAAEISLALDDLAGACRIARHGLALSGASGRRASASPAFRLSVAFGRTAPLGELAGHEATLVALATTDMEIAIAYGTLATRWFGAGDNRRAVAAVLAGLAALGLATPRSVGRLRAAAALSWTNLLASFARWASRMRRAPQAKRALIDAEAFLIEKGAPTLYSSEIHLYGWLRARAALHQLTIGGSLQYSSNSGMTVAMASAGRLAMARRWARLTLDVLPENQSYGRASALYRATFFGEIWRQSFAQLAEINRRVVDYAIVEGDQLYAAYGVRNLVNCLWYANDDLAHVSRVADEYANLLVRLGDVGNRRIVESIVQAIAKLRAGIDQPLTLDGDIVSAADIDQLARMNNWDAWAICKTIDLQLRVVDGDFAAAREIVGELAPRADNLRGTLVHPFYCAFAVIAHARTANLAGASRSLRGLRTYARTCPDAFAALRDLCHAELAAARRRPGTALYDRAAETALRLGRNVDRALIHRLAASAARSLGLVAESSRHAAAAEIIWRRLGVTRFLPSPEELGRSAADITRLSPVAEATSLDQACQRAADILADLYGIDVGLAVPVEGAWRQWTSRPAIESGDLRRRLSVLSAEAQPDPNRAVSLHVGGLIGVVVVGDEGRQGASALARLAPLASWLATAIDRHRLAAEVATIRSRLAASTDAARADAEASAARERALASRSATFMATIGHELRGPLAAVGALIEVSAQAPASTGHLVALRSAFLSLRELVDDLLTVGLCEAGKLPINRVPFDPAEAARIAGRLAEAQHGADGRRLAVAVDDCPGAVVGDARRLQQILLNLLSNAYRHASAGSVTLTARFEDEVHAVRCRFTVEDEGPGLGTRGAADLFKPFSTTLPASGSGLGLSVSRHLAAALGGTLTATSRLGPGASFCLEVAFDKALAAARPPAAPRALSVLLVDDLELTRTSYATLLGVEGWRVVAVETGEQALDVLGRTAFDLVLLDLSLPGWDGLETLHRMTGQLSDRHDRPALVLFTAMPSPGIVERAKAAGADAVLAKPATREEIVAVAASLVPASIPEDAADAGRLAHLLDALGGDGVGTILSAAQMELPSLVEDLTNAGTTEARRLAAHRLHGFAAHLGLDDLARFAAGVEADLSDIGMTDGLLERSSAAIEEMRRVAMSHHERSLMLTDGGS
jgi:signal transduction histidine kinase/FixJ family two-component response regulator